MPLAIAIVLATIGFVVVGITITDGPNSVAISNQASVIGATGVESETEIEPRGAPEGRDSRSLFARAIGLEVSDSDDEIPEEPREERTTTRSTDNEVVESEEPVVFTVPTIRTLAAQDIEEDQAVLRGEVDMKTQPDGLVFVAFGYDFDEVADIAVDYDRFRDIPRFRSDAFTVTSVDSRARGVEQYRKQVNSLVADTEYFYRFCVEYDDEDGSPEILCSRMGEFETDEDNLSNGERQEPRANTDDAINVESDEALLRGEVDMNDYVDGIVFFAYGEDEERVRRIDLDFDRFSRIEEDDENLQTARVGTDVRGDNEFERRVDDLDDGTEIFYQICVEYDGIRDDLVCGGVESFETDGRSRKDTPDSDTGSATVSGTDAVIRGEVDMNDFIDGIVFMVFGTDRAEIIEVAEKDEFDDVRQSGDKIQRVLVDSDLDGEDRYTVNANDLLDNTLYSYRICVEYEDEDEDGDDENFLACGDIETFKTN